MSWNYGNELVGDGVRLVVYCHNDTQAYKNHLKYTHEPDEEGIDTSWEILAQCVAEVYIKEYPKTLEEVIKFNKESLQCHEVH